MKFLIHGNAPFVKSGYGVQVALLADRLDALGHEVAVSSTYGQQGAAGTWTTTSGRPITVYPCGYEINGNDVVHGHALHHFDGDPLDGWIITLLDVWALRTPLLADFNVASWCPVDHFPTPPEVVDYFKRTGATPIAMSRFGERLLFDAGLDPVYIPLSVDTKVMQPTPTVRTASGILSARALLDIPRDAFCVGMVAMNKGWARDRKGFNEAFRAFGAFWQDHPEAILYLHAEKFGGAEGINLVELAQHCAIPEHAIRWVDQYAYRLGVPPGMMAATYTAVDVLLAPSHGEGFCVPLLEAQACGTPVICTDFSSQPELVGSGWLVSGQPEWDPSQRASYVCPFVDEIVNALEKAHAADLPAMIEPAARFAAMYDTDAVFEDFWLPFLASLEPQESEPPSYEREPIGERDAIAVIVPAMRPENMARLYRSFAETNDGAARLVVVADEGSALYGEADVALQLATADDLVTLLSGEGDPRDSTYAEKVNTAFSSTTEPWVLLVGDDVEFKPGWIEEARKLSDRYDVIGTNDSSNGVKNPDVAAGRHSDHSFFRRAYVDTLGACLDGPGVLAPECYGHWFVDKEQIGLAKARGVFAPCLSSIVEHHHPGYDGREDLRQADPVYMRAIECAEADRRLWQSRAPLVEMQRVSRGKPR